MGIALFLLREHQGAWQSSEILGRKIYAILTPIAEAQARLTIGVSSLQSFQNVLPYQHILKVKKIAHDLISGLLLSGQRG